MTTAPDALRLGVVCDPLRGDVSGPSRYLREVLARLRRPKDRFVGVSMKPFEERLDLFDEHLVLRSGHRPGLPGRVLDQVWRYPRRLAREPLDLLFSPTRMPPAYFWFAAPPKVLTIHGGVDYELEDRLHPSPGWRMRWTYRLLRHRLKVVVTVSASARREVVDHFGLPPDRVRVIHEGVDREVFYPPEGEPDGGVEGPYLLHVSNYQPKKNGEGIVEAWRRVREMTGRDLRLVFAGGHYRGFESVRESVRKAGLEGRFEHAGRVSDDRLRRLYGGARAFVFPSHHEGFGLPILEAMACGVPVVTSDVYGCAEVAGEAALKVDPADPEAIAGAIRRLLEEPETRRRMIRRGKKRAEAFSWADTARRHRAVFGSVLGHLDRPGAGEGP